MSHVPKVGVKQNTHDGLWKSFGERLVGRFMDSQRPIPSKLGLSKARLRLASKLRLNRIFQEEDGG